MKAFIPEAVKIPDRKVLTITTVGDPTRLGKEFFGALYGTAYSTKFKTFKPKGIKMELGKLCALWPDAHLRSKDKWTGIWAIPVPDYVVEKDVIQKDSDNPVKLEVWKGGTYAQVLHKGPFSEEGPTVGSLHAFIKSEMNVEMEDIPGTHEEEYLTSPEAKNQKTIIRYRVS